MKTNWFTTAAVCCALSVGTAFGLPCQGAQSAATTKHQSAKSKKTDAPANKDAQSENGGDPFTNNHYVLTGTLPMNGFHKGAPTVVVVDKGSHFTYVLQLQNNKIVRVYTASNDIGNADKPTPPGRYTVVRKQMYPKWIPPKTIKHAPVAPYNQTHKNPLGVAAIYLNKFDIDLHGTNEPNLIRKSTSHGCVRHSNGDILKLYGMINRGDVVYIVNKFRGKVLDRADFSKHGSKTKHVAQTDVTPSAEPSVTTDKHEHHKHTGELIYYYTIDT
ncbi:MAG TPA: L,D-transpeptidase [Planktothrix sp.]